MKTSFLPNTNEIIWRISALLHIYLVLYDRAEILKIISLEFGRNDVFIKSFWFLLTFQAHISLYSRLREMEESLIQVFLPKLMHLRQLRSLLILSLMCKGPACKITYSIVGTYNKVFSLFSFLLLILDQNWVLLGDETHMANLLSPTQVLRRAAWR